MAVDPFRYVDDAAPVIRQLAQHIHAITRPSASSIWIGRGYAADSTEHRTRRALDIIVSAVVGRMPTPAEKSLGDLVVAWLIRYADALHIRHIIWDGRIWKRRYRNDYNDGWSRLTGRNGVSDWHHDHVHVLLDDAAGIVPTHPLIPGNLIEGDNDMDPNDLATAILAHEITANGKTAPLATHLGELFVLNKAQSVAVGTEATRDKQLAQAAAERDKAILARLDQVIAEVRK